MPPQTGQRTVTTVRIHGWKMHWYWCTPLAGTTSSGACARRDTAGADVAEADRGAVGLDRRRGVVHGHVERRDDAAAEGLHLGERVQDAALVDHVQRVARLDALGAVVDPPGAGCRRCCSAAVNWAAVTEPLFTQKLGPKVASKDSESHSSSRRMSLTLPESATRPGR